MIHSEPSPLAGQTVRVEMTDYRTREKEVVDYRVEDWWDRVGECSWMDARGNPACMNYAFRAGSLNLPIDNQVLYGKIGGSGHLIHVSEVLA